MNCAKCSEDLSRWSIANWKCSRCGAQFCRDCIGRPRRLFPWMQPIVPDHLCPLCGAELVSFLPI